MQSRYYDAGVGRFVNADEAMYLGMSGGTYAYNLYAYCENDPVNDSDLNGHFGTPIQWAMAIIGGIAGWLLGDYVARGLGYYPDRGRFWDKATYWTIRTGVIVGGSVVGWFAGSAIIKIVTRFLLQHPSILTKVPGAVLSFLGLHPDIGNKLNYIFGQATGLQHNIERSIQMYNQLKSIGIWDTPYWREYLNNFIVNLYNNAVNCYVQSNGRIVIEAMLYGPGGGLKIKTIWEGLRLITIELFG